MHASGRTGASRTSDLFFFSLPRTSLGFSPFSTLCTASLELNWRYTTHIGNIYHSHTCTKFIQCNCTNTTLSLIVGCKHGREKVWSYRHYAKRGYKKGPQDVLLSATPPPPPQCSYHLSTYCHNKQLLILASILHSNQRLEVVKRLLGERELGGGGGGGRGTCPHAPFHPHTHECNHPTHTHTHTHSHIHPPIPPTPDPPTHPQTHSHQG